MEHDTGRTPEAHLAMRERLPGGPRKTITSLTVMVKAVERGMWPTPQARHCGPDRTKIERYRKGTSSSKSESLETAVDGPLNPTWVEWLMGFPLGWTDCEPSATPSSPKSQNSSGGE